MPKVRYFLFKKISLLEVQTSDTSGESAQIIFWNPFWKLTYILLNILHVRHMSFLAFN